MKRNNADRNVKQLAQLSAQLVLVALTWCGLVGTAIADNRQARALLDKMSHSFRELNYQGAFSYQQGDVTQSLRITHAVIDGEEYERLEYMDGERREVLRRGHHLSCIHPGHQLVRLYQQHQQVKNGTPPNSTNRPDLINYYDISMLQQGRVAGREVMEILVSPKDTHRFVHQLSIDTETGLLLRSIVKGDAGKVLERFQFADIQIGVEIPLEHFQGADHSYQAEHIDPERSAVVGNQPQWSVNWLPGGFTAVVVNQDATADDMVTFTDGFAVFSVFLEKEERTEPVSAELDRNVEGHARRGATVAYSRPLTLSGVPHRVTVVGEIPQQTARKVAQSVALVQP